MNHYLEKPSTSYTKTRTDLASLREQMVSSNTKAVDILREKRAQIITAMLYQHKQQERRNVKVETTNSTIPPLPTLPPMPNPFVMPDFLLNDLFIESTSEIAADVIDPDMVSIEQPNGSESDFETIEESGSSQHHSEDFEDEGESNPDNEDDYEDYDSGYDDAEYDEFHDSSHDRTL